MFELRCAKYTYSFSPDVLKEIQNTIGKHPPETGGMLGSSDGKTITHYYFDHTAKTTQGTYSPNQKACTDIISKWKSEKVSFVGVIHSHPDGAIRPSRPDIHYAERIMDAFNLKKLFMPIVSVNSFLDGTVTIYSYEIKRGSFTEGHCLDRIFTLGDQFKREANTPAHEDELAYHKISKAVPMDALAKKLVVVVGTGGSIGLIESLARTGVSNFILIDGDQFDISNICNQAVYRRDLGQYKVDAVKNRILDINPRAKVTAIKRYLCEYFFDTELDDLIGKEYLSHPKDVLIVAATDSFYAQKRVTAMAMNLGTVFMAPQIYKQGCGAEIVFSYPGVTPACPRCVLNSRYEAYNNGYLNTVISDGTLFSSIMQANALETQVALMLLLYGEGDNTYTKMLDEVADRNLVLLRMQSDADELLGLDLFKDKLSNYAFLGDVIWLPTTPLLFDENGLNCPICGGEGDIKRAMYTIPDTREV